MARALALDEIDRDASRAAVLEAVKLAPDLVPAAALAGRRLSEGGETRKAARIMEAAWKANPHPDIAETYANMRFGDSARDRLARMRKLAAKVAGQLEGALAVARAALEAQEFKLARDTLAPYLSAPTRRVAALMAEIEQAEHGDEGRVREWMARAMRASGDPVWTADGVVSDRWLPVTPNGRLDGFEWKVPLAEIGVSRTVIEVTPPPAPSVPEQAAPAIDVIPAETEAKIETKAEAKAETKSEAKPEAKTTQPAPEADAKPAADESPRKAQKANQPTRHRPAEPVIPLVHAPDDPGPEDAPDHEPVPEPSAPQNDPWQRIRSLFR
jgi:HemY protein